MASSSSSKQVINWLELPPELMCLIFTKVGAIDILKVVQSVCSTWRKLAKEPQLFRTIDICCDNVDDLYDEEYEMMVELAKEAVNRSCGQLVDLSIRDFASNELLQCIISQNSPLRRLRFAHCLEVSDYAVVEMTNYLPLLEELEIFHCDFGFSDEFVETFGRACPLLKSFTLNYWLDDDPSSVGSQEAVAIAQNMPELRQLNLIGTFLTDNGLRAILDGCPHLNYLDLSYCSNLTFAPELVKMCVDKNIKLRLSDEASMCKLITQIERQTLSLKEHLKPINEANLEAGFNAKLYAISYKFFVLNELSQMWSMMSVWLENIILIGQRKVRVARMMQMVQEAIRSFKT